MAFAFFPPVLIFLVSITNNVFLLSTIALALALLSFYPKQKNRWFLVTAMCVLLVAALIRRDAFLFVMPLVVCTGAFLTRWRFIGAVGAGVVFFVCFAGFNKWAASRIPGYSKGINSTEIIAIFDLVGMSALKGEMLIPESVLKAEYQGEGRVKVMEQIAGIKDLYNDHYFYHGFEVTERPYWTNGLTVQKALPVYLENLPWYLRFRANYVWQNFTRTDSLIQSAYFYPDFLEMMGVEAFPNLHPIVMKIQSARVKVSGLAAKFFPFLFQLWFYLVLSFGCVFLIWRKIRSGTADGIDRFLLLLLANIWAAIGLLCVASVVIQLRYPFAYAFFVWPIFVYLLKREMEERRLRF